MHDEELNLGQDGMAEEVMDDCIEMTDEEGNTILFHIRRATTAKSWKSSSPWRIRHSKPS